MTLAHRTRQVMSALGRKTRAARNRIVLTLRMFRQKSPAQIARRVIRLIKEGGPMALYRHWRLLLAHHQALHQGAQPISATPRRVPAMPRHEYTPLSSIDMSRYDYLLLDVFDTAVIRLVCQPTDLFEYLGIQAGRPGFRAQRVAQEAAARAAQPQRKDIHIRDIYQRLAGADMQAEIDAELQFCLANPEIQALYRDWVKAGKKVFFVSDMYLDHQTVTDLLHANGYTTYEAVYVSSRDDLIKGDGSRFAWLKKQIPGLAGRSLHLGDNSISDFIQPRTHGIDAIHTVEAPDYYLREPFIRSKMAFLEPEDRLGISFMLASFRHWKSSFANSTPSYWQQFGFLYGGAMVTAFCEFIHEKARQQHPSITKIFFLARDGDILSQVFRLLYDDIEAVYLYASRRCMILPALTELNYESDGDFLRQFTNTIGISTHDDIISRFAYPDLDGLAADLEKTCPDARKLTEANIYACIQRNQDEIREKIKSERQTLSAYLGHVGFFDHNPIVVADVGWGGSIQDALHRLLALQGHADKSIHGYYLGVNSQVAHASHKHGLLFNGDQTAFLDYVNLIELLTAAPHDGIVRIEPAGDAFEPVTPPPCDEEERRKAAALEIQKGILGFANLVKQQKLRVRDLVATDDFHHLFRALQVCGSQDDARHLEQLRHPTAIGGNYAHRVLAGQMEAAIH